VKHPVGLHGLLRELQLDVPPPTVRSESGAASRRTIERPEAVVEIYPQNYQCNTLQEHLRFALRYEPLDLRVWHHILKALPPTVITDWVRNQPNSVYARRAWYLFERLAKRRLAISDSRAPYAEIASGDIQVVRESRSSGAPLSKRHRIRNNLLGTASYCPLIRRTTAIKSFQTKDFGQAALALAEGLSPELFRRAASYLYRAETRASYAIEGETPSLDREERFLSVLSRAGLEDIGPEAGLVRLQNAIVQDARFTASGWRQIQNYVGRTRLDYSEEVKYICPRPEDLPILMKGWMELVGKIARADKSDVVPLAACASFGFVYLHPFEDGNGRLHRFLIHDLLARYGYTPEGVIFPVSAVIHRRLKDYEAVLETVSRLVNPGANYTLDDQNRMTVSNETQELYLYPDLTKHTEFLYQCIEETVAKDWPEGLSFLLQFDGACRDVRDVVELPDNRLRLLVRLLLQNHGRLSHSKKPLFEDLSAEELSRIEAAITNRLGPDPE
jgi:hypothetical protein